MDSNSSSRLNLLSHHLTNSPNAKTKNTMPFALNLLDKYRLLSTIDPVLFRRKVYGRHSDERDRILKKIEDDPEFISPHNLELDRKESRENSYKLLKRFHKLVNPSYDDYLKDSAKYNAYVDALWCFDMSTAGRYGINFYLYLRTLINFGNEKHRPFIERVFNGTDIGCFALTELAHGSNAKDIQTTAVFDSHSNQFILNTPSDMAMKFWIGNAGEIANTSVVFAQLLINDKNYGVHAFIVPLRNKNHDVFPGLVIGDCGEKIGLNGIDNGFLIFKHYRIPKENFLDRFSKISDNGEFSTIISNPEKRFGMQLIALSEGRIQISSRSITNLINCVTIAARFCASRRQFGLPDKPESPILDYPLVQYRLLKYLSGSIILKLSIQRLYALWYDNLYMCMDPENPLTAEIHALISAMKPICTWNSSAGIQECRELCGGFGFSTYNRIGVLRADNDINTTWEGDNNVLGQQTARFLLECLRFIQKGKKIPYTSLEKLNVNFVEGKCELKSKNDMNKSEYLIKIYEYKLNYLLQASLKKVKENMGKYPDFLDAWNNSQLFYLQSAAQSYGILFAITASYKLIRDIPHKPTRKIFKKLHDLWALMNLESTHNQIPEYFTKEQVIWIKECIEENCKDLKNEIVGIIDAIACSDRILGSPIGASDGNLYPRFLQTIYGSQGCFQKPSYWRDIINKNL